MKILNKNSFLKYFFPAQKLKIGEKLSHMEGGVDVGYNSPIRVKKSGSIKFKDIKSSLNGTFRVTVVTYKG